jgi:hypothetical protein
MEMKSVNITYSIEPQVYEIDLILFASKLLINCMMQSASPIYYVNMYKKSINIKRLLHYKNLVRIVDSTFVEMLKINPPKTCSLINIL